MGSPEVILVSSGGRFGIVWVSFEMILMPRVVVIFMRTFAVILRVMKIIL